MGQRKVHTGEIGKAVYDLIYSSSFFLPAGVLVALQGMRDGETDRTGKETLAVLCDNAQMAPEDRLPLCQDCGAVIVFLELGQEVCLQGPGLGNSINLYTARAYEEFYLRKSIVSDPLRRVNTGTNTPCFIHTDIVEGDRISLTVYLKGGGSENMTRLKMFRPTASPDEIVLFAAESVREAGPNPCPPVFLGIGIGGTADAAMINAKRAVLRGVNTSHPDPFYAHLEQRVLEAVNATGVGPLGYGGKNTAAGVYIREAPSHIASLPVALNINCHSLRYRKIEL